MLFALYTYLRVTNPDSPTWIECIILAENATPYSMGSSIQYVVFSLALHTSIYVSCTKCSLTNISVHIISSVVDPITGAVCGPF